LQFIFTMMKSILFFIFLFIQVNISLAQKIITGKVTNQTTGLPVPAASIYISNTSIGTTSNANGEFNLTIPTSYRIDLVASCVGYSPLVQSIAPSDTTSTFKIQLIPNSKDLETVILNSYEKDGWKKWGKYFTENIFGIIPEAKNCTLTNPETVRFVYDKKTQTLNAYATEPLVITNTYLGYTLQYDLGSFKVQFKNNMLEYVGTPFFINMGGSAKQQRKWKERRYIAYIGSVMHFMRALHENRLAIHGFEVKRLVRLPNVEKQRVKAIYKQQIFNKKGTNFFDVKNDSFSYYNHVVRQPDFLDYVNPNALTADSILVLNNGNDKKLFFENYLYVTHNFKKNVLVYERGEKKMVSQFPTSIVTLQWKEPITFYKNGSYYEPTNFFLEGFWAQSEKLSTILPFDYDPY
jgi:hypothetical protein